MQYVEKLNINLNFVVRVTYPQNERITHPQNDVLC